MKVFEPHAFHAVPNDGDLLWPVAGDFFEAGDGEHQVLVAVECVFFRCCSEVEGDGGSFGRVGDGSRWDE